MSFKLEPPDVEVWTEEDEHKLIALQERKQRVQDAKLKRVENFLNHETDLGTSECYDLAKDIINNWDRWKHFFNQGI